MKLSTLHILLFIMTFFMDVRVKASERYRYYTGIRQMGMGGASVTVVNDETSLLLNPAGLGKLRGSIITLLDPEITADSNLYDLYNSSSTTGASLSTLQGQVDAAELKPKTHYHAKGQLFPSIVIPNFGFGILAKYSYDFETDTTAANTTVTHYNDLAAVIGYNFRLFDGRIKLGFNGRFMNRVELYNKTYTAAQTGLDYKNVVSEGGGIGSDVGLLIAGPWAWLPTIGGVVHDVGNTRFNTGSGLVYKTGVEPLMVPQTIDASLAVFPIHGNKIRSSWTVEYVDVTNALEPNSTDVNRRIHAGMEINFGDMLFLRGGLNQRYYTAGLEFAMEHVQLQFSTYGEEVGTDTILKEDRRYQMKFSLRF